MAKFKNEDLQLYIKLVNIAYKGANNLPKGYLKENLPDNLQLFLTPDEVECNNYSYAAAVFIDEAKKEIIVANAGTRISLTHPLETRDDLIADAELFLHIPPTKFTQDTQKFLECLIHVLGESAKEFNFIFTGHSLGAAIAELSDVYMTHLGFVTQAITFDSPGSRPLAEHLIKSLESDVVLEDLQITVVNSRPNFVNTTNTQLGDVHETLPKEVIEYQHPVQSSWLTILPAKFLAFFGINKVLTDVKEHSLSSFSKYAEFAEEETDILAPVDVDESQPLIDGKRTVTYDQKTFSTLATIDTSPVGLYYMVREVEVDDGFLEIDHVSFNASDLVAARTLMGEIA